jgi:hypothetical protein
MHPTDFTPLGDVTALTNAYRGLGNGRDEPWQRRNQRPEGAYRSGRAGCGGSTNAGLDLSRCCDGVIGAIEHQQVRIPFLKIDRTIEARFWPYKERASPISGRARCE